MQWGRSRGDSARHPLGWALLREAEEPEGAAKVEYTIVAFLITEQEPTSSDFSLKGADETENQKEEGSV